MSHPLEDLQPEERELFVGEMRNLMRNPSARRLVWMILQMCPVYRISMDSLNGTASSFMEGERNVGLKVIRLLEEVDPQLYPLMLLAEAQAVQPPRTDDEAV